MPQPQQSLIANKHMETSGKKASHSDLVLSALMNMPNGGNYEQIAMRCGLTPVQVQRRLLEIKDIRRTGKTSPTSSNVPAEIWKYEPPVMFELNGKQGELFAA